MVCEVCYKPLEGDAKVDELPEELQDQVYRPGVDGMVEDVELEFPENAPTYSRGNWELVKGEDEPD